MVKEMAPKKALAPLRTPRPPAGTPPAHLRTMLLPKAKVKPLLVPKLPGWAAHQAEQNRRMEWALLCKDAEDDFDSLVQVATLKCVAPRMGPDVRPWDGFDGSGTPDSFNQNDDGSQRVYPLEAKFLLWQKEADENAKEKAKEEEAAASGYQGVWAGEDDDSLDPMCVDNTLNSDGEYNDPSNQVDSDPEDYAAVTALLPTDALLKALALRSPR